MHMQSVDVVKYIWTHPGNRRRRLRALADSVGWQLEKRLTGHTRDIRVFGDLRLRCYPDSCGAGIMIYANGWYDYDDMHFVQGYLRPGDAVVDVGANIGVYTLLAAAVVGDQGKVVAFEPGREAFARLQENVQLNRLHQVELHCAAVGETRGMVSFFQNQDLINRIALADEQPTQPDAIEFVPCVALDEELAGERFDLGKIDIEGAELMAFRGAQQMLQRANPPVWLVELKDRLQRRYGSTARELARLLQASGFELGNYDADRGLLSFPPEPWQGHENVLAIHRTALDRVRSRLAAHTTPGQPVPSSPSPRV
jgi:FkbM family methyltransferase